MITRDLFRLTHPSYPQAACISSRAQCEEWRDSKHLAHPVETYVIELEPHCGCCGASFSLGECASSTTWAHGETRCDRHHDRNPCAIDGCKRTTAAPLDTAGFPFIRSDQWMCGEHWRRFVPPRSARRRAYHAFFRKAKRFGWTPALERKFWRFWNTLVAQARRKAAVGTIDEAEINRLFGWDAAGGAT